VVLATERIEQLTEPAADLARLSCSFTALSWSAGSAREVGEEIDWIERTTGATRLVVNAMRHEARPDAELASPQEASRLWQVDVGLVQQLLTGILARMPSSHSRTSEQPCIGFVDAACRCEARTATDTPQHASGMARTALTETAAKLYAPFGASICSVCPHMLPRSPSNDACIAVAAARPPPRCGTDPDAFAGMLRTLVRTLRFEASTKKQRHPRNARHSATST
jgi:hypothetical protein